MTDRSDFVARETVRWPIVTARAWQRMVGASESAISAWRNGRSEPRPASLVRLTVLADIRREGTAALGARGFDAFVLSRPTALGGDTVVGRLCGTLDDQRAVLAHMREWIAANRAEDARIEAELKRRGPSGRP